MVLLELAAGRTRLINQPSKALCVLSLRDDLLSAAVALPKIELHRHLEGSVRLATLVDIAQTHGMELNDEASLRPFVQMMPEEPRDSQRFLSKFLTLRQFYRTEDIVTRIAGEVVEDAALDNVKYLELRFTPKALCNFIGTPMPRMVGLVCEAGNEIAKKHNIQVRYIISMNRHESTELGENALNAALQHTDKGVVGLDLAGDEAHHSALPFRDIFLRAKAAGLFVTVHAGEWAGANSIWDAVGNLRADRVGHGIKLLNDPAMTRMIVERGIALEVCPTSNYLSGIVAKLEDHPITELTRQGVVTTLNTDDPSICAVTLSQEIAQACQYLHMTIDDIKGYTLRAAQHAFLPRDERVALVRSFQNEFAAVAAK
jgi:adenosine deaminase